MRWVEHLWCRWGSWCWERSVSRPWLCSLQSHSFSPKLRIYKTSSPTLPWSSPHPQREKVHLSGMLISGNLFYTFRFPSGRYLCWRFHASKNDVYRPLWKMAHQWCSRCMQTPTIGRAVGRCSPRTVVRTSPAWRLLKSPGIKAAPCSRASSFSPLGPSFKYWFLKFSLIGFGRSKRGL